MIQSIAFRQIPRFDSPARTERKNKGYRRHNSRTESRSSSWIEALHSSSKELSNELSTEKTDVGLHPEEEEQVFIATAMGWFGWFSIPTPQNSVVQQCVAKERDGFRTRISYKRYIENTHMRC